MTQSTGDLLGRCLTGVGADRVFGSPDSGIRRLPGLRHVAVSEPSLAVLLADAAGRLGRGPGVALLPGQRLHLGSQPGAAPEVVVVDDVSALPAVIAGWSFGQVHAAVDIEVALDLDAPAPEGVEPLRFDEGAGEMLALSPSLASFRSLVLAGPGVVRGGFVAALRRFAEQSGFGVVNTWGAKGVFVWDSPYHLGTAGPTGSRLRAGGLRRRRARGGCGARPARVAPIELGPRAGARRRAVAARRAGVAVGDASRAAAASAPLHPAGRCSGRSLRLAGRPPQSGAGRRRSGPGDAARRPRAGRPGASRALGGSGVSHHRAGKCGRAVVVRAGFAAAGAVVAALDHRPTVAVVADPPDAATLELLALAEHWGSAFTLEIWGADTSLASPEAHIERLAGSFAEPGVKLLPVPVDFAQTKVLVEVAGEVVAWRDPVLQSADG
jgi:hypothetical protein